MDSIWSYVVTIIGLIGFYFVGKKMWWAWYINIFNQVLWAVYAIVTEQWGFLIGVAFYTTVFVKNAIEWTEEHRRPEPPNPLGYTTSMKKTDFGISVEGKLTEEAADWIRKQGM